MKNYNEIMNEFLMLDKNERIPLSLTIKLLFNRKCRNEVRLLTKAEKLAKKPLSVQMPVTDKTIHAVLNQINPEFAEKAEIKNPFPLSRWITAGIAMTAMMIFLGIMTRTSSDQLLVLPFYVLFATVFTTYCAFFVGCNMDFFVKKIETHKLAM